ncbi:MAG: glutamate--tRNA ligase family protein [Planctomycetota bacterium]
MSDPAPLAPRITRLAPSPTGALHLGNVRTFLINWAAARQGGWRVRLRIEDLDGPRVKPEAAREAIELLHWLGMDWDGEPVYQTHDLRPYEAALAMLKSRGRVYRCPATRREIEAAALSAPHGDEHELRYPGLYRPRQAGDGEEVGGDHAEAVSAGGGHSGGGSGGRSGGGAGEGSGGEAVIPEGVPTAWRLMVPDGPVCLEDELLGWQVHDVQRQVGDFVVWTKAGLPAYQLAVVVDDARQGVTDVVRGDDLLRSAARQRLVYEALDRGPTPRYYHVPLVYGPDGRRLAKRHGDTRAAAYRARGVSAARVVGLMAWWCGLSSRREPMDAAGFARRFAWANLPRDPVTFTKEDEAWLTGNG